ncbi:MAG: tRNA cytidylyltransferase [Gemmatimonadaceae bacterium]|nr:tRNA cytidylyltransferase [Gemmatimonadaceae bacterium]
MQPPATVLEIAQLLLRAGHESWFVGGAVRDALLGHANLDWDIATAATPQQVQKLFRRTVPVGIDFGTVGVLDKDGVMHEVTTFRRDVQTDGRHAVVEFGASFEEDLARRDFTINAIAYSPNSREIFDPFHGRKDLADRLVRAVGVAADRMREDRLRALRAMRFAARFGFAIESETWAAITESAPHLGRLSMERVQQEIEKTMQQVERPGDAFRLWRNSGAFAVVAPPLAEISDVALATLDLLPRARDASAEQTQHTVNRLTALVLDVEPAAARDLLRGLRFSNERVHWVGDLLERWHALAAEIRESVGGESWSDGAMRRWVAAIGRTRVDAFFTVLDARFAAEDGDSGPIRRGGVRALRDRAGLIALRDPLETGDLSIDGGDLMKAGIKAGPQLGSTLRALLEWVLDDPARNTNDQLLARASELAGAQHS